MGAVGGMAQYRYGVPYVHYTMGWAIHNSGDKGSLGRSGALVLSLSLLLLLLLLPLLFIASHRIVRGQARIAKELLDTRVQSTLVYIYIYPEYLGMYGTLDRRIIRMAQVPQESGQRTDDRASGYVSFHVHLLGSIVYYTHKMAYERTVGSLNRPEGSDMCTILPTANRIH